MGQFKMKYQGVPALLKALTGGQKEMVSKMREQGKTSAADKIEKGILAQPEKAAAKKYGTEPMKKDPDAKKKALEKARKAREEFQRQNPDAKFKTETKQPAKPKSEIKTTVKGDLPSGGYSPEQKEKAIAQAAKTAAEKKRAKLKAEGYDVEAKNRSFRENTTMGRALTRQGFGAAPKKVKGMGPVKKTGVGTKSIKERIYEDGRKKKKANTAKRATMTKKMYKK